ncbi:hypothetical protein [Thiothrix lacustris]|uniref:hypothetical protein n=1 Tax=Thiothrix lacustris TaxID=525917 RepID=UPI00048B3DB4|nr:hypothetical protein [Thiothrix lacustris]
MTTFKTACLKRHELTAKLEALHQCRATLAEYNVTTKGVDSLIEAKTQEIESLTLDIDDRKALIDKFLKIRTHRQFQGLPSLINGLRSEIANGQASVERKRQALVDSGIQAEEAKRIIADYDAIEAVQKLEPLTSELASWIAFSETGLASDLPPNADELFESYEDFGSGCQRPQNLYSLNHGV